MRSSSELVNNFILVLFPKNKLSLNRDFLKRILVAWAPSSSSSSSSSSLPSFWVAAGMFLSCFSIPVNPLRFLDQHLLSFFGDLSLFINPFHLWSEKLLSSSRSLLFHEMMTSLTKLKISSYLDQHLLLHYLRSIN